MELRTFKALLLSAAILISALMVGAVVLLNYRSPEQTNVKSGFSVRWMGFAPTYNNTYPEYYICINDLKSDTLVMNIALQIKNQEDRGYYFKIEKYVDPPTGWTVLPMTIGYVDGDETKAFTYSASRTKPTTISDGLPTENVSLVVKAYYDPSLTNLYSQDNFNVTFNFIDRLASGWTMIYRDNFDDGTTQGWSAVGSWVQPPIVTDIYYRSFRYSLQLHSGENPAWWTEWAEAGYSKSFIIGAGTQQAYLIYSIKSTSWPTSVRIAFDGVIVFQPDVQPNSNTWYQFTIPLPKSEIPGMSKTTMVEVWATSASDAYAYLDDVYVIVK